LNRASLLRGGTLRAPDRLINYLYDTAWTPALLRSQLVARETLKAMQMRELSPMSLRLRVLLQIALAFVRHLLRLRQPTPTAQGPKRDELLLQLSADNEQDAAAK